MSKTTGSVRGRKGFDMTDTARKGELLLNDMAEPLEQMAQAHEAFCYAVVPDEVLEWLGVSGDTYVDRLGEACDDLDAAIDTTERHASDLCDGGDPDAFERAAKDCLDDLAAVDVPGAADVDGWVRSLTAAFELRLRKGSDDLLEASARLRCAKEAAVEALENALL